MTPFDVEVESDDGRAFPWAPQPGETALGFSYFQAYRSAGAGRTIAQTARDTGRDPGTLRALSAKFAWVDRALAFDRYVDARSVEELIRGRTQMRQEHATVAVLAREKIMARLKSIDPEEMNVRDLATMLDLSVKIERQARGEADKTLEIKGEVTVEGLDAAARRALMEQAMAALGQRLGVPVYPELEAYEEAEVVEEETDGGESRES